MAERNRLLLAGGFAPPYLGLPYHGQVMQPSRESFRLVLNAHQPNRALIVDGLWNLIDANPAASLAWDSVDPVLRLHTRLGDVSLFALIATLAHRSR